VEQGKVEEIQGCKGDVDARQVQEAFMGSEEVSCLSTTGIRVSFFIYFSINFSIESCALKREYYIGRMLCKTLKQ
jgi:hypothetical protein